MSTSSISHILHTRSMSRHGLVLALVFAFLVMAMTVVEQDRTIEAQKKLIRMLWSDSNELTAMKLARAHEHAR